MPIQRYQYFTPTDAARISKLELMARQVVEGFITGQHKSPHHGFSAEFVEHREYSPGDELRHLDWKAYARSDRHYIKLYEQETNLRATLVLDNSASMTYAGKVEYARRLCACLAFLLASQQDLAGLAAVDDSLRIELPGGSSPAHLDRLFRALEKLQVGKNSALAGQLHDLAERLPRRSLVIILSDLWLDPAELSRALQHLRYKKHQVIMLHLLDKSEIDLPYDKPVTLIDPETDERIQIDPAQVKQTYSAQVREHLAWLRRLCNDCGGEYHLLDVSRPYDRALADVLGRRK